MGEMGQFRGNDPANYSNAVVAENVKCCGCLRISTSPRPRDNRGHVIPDRVHATPCIRGFNVLAVPTTFATRNRATNDVQVLAVHIVRDLCVVH